VPSLTHSFPPSFRTGGAFLGEAGVSGAQNTTVVIDYQNVHLTGHSLFESTEPLLKHETLVHPLLFANRLLQVRNQSQQPGHPNAVLLRVLVYRGVPSPEHDPKGCARNQAQKGQWERDPRVQVTLRPLKYQYARTAEGVVSTDSTGRKVVAGPPQEKGVDVLCALAAIREAQDPAMDMVILASSDTDLAPALDEVRRLGTAKVETSCWYNTKRPLGYQLHPTNRSAPVWNTRLDEESFRATWDRTHYA
jgi:uncharacterized LabA/DUF88 family protein